MTTSDVVTADAVSALMGDGAMARYAGGHERPSQEEIARLAYHFYEERGRQDGRDVDDWLSAERELIHHYR